MATASLDVQRNQRLDAARQFAIESARLAAETLCHNVVVLEVAGLSPVTDFFVLATGTSPRQMRTVGEEAQDLAEKHDYQAISKSGYDGGSWILIDFVDVILHVFNDDARAFYDLDNLWGDAKRIEWRRE